MEAFNAAADWLAGEAFRLRTANKVKLQQLYYHQLREDFGLSAQMAIRCIAQVCEACSRDKSKRPRFKKYASVPYDQRLEFPPTESVQVEWLTTSLLSLVIGHSSSVA
jgi:putative transposase